MENYKNDEPMQLTGKHIESLLLFIAVTITGFVITRFLIIPNITFIQYFFIEIVVSRLIMLSSRLLRRK